MTSNHANASSRRAASSIWPTASMKNTRWSSTTIGSTGCSPRPPTIRRDEGMDRRVYFKRAVPPARRARQAAGLGRAQQAEDRRDLRGPQLRRQGRRHQAHHAAAQSAHLPGRRAAGAERARADPMVLPALCRASAGGRRNRAVRPELVQPRRRRARHGILHRGRRRRSSSARCRSSSACWCAPASC